MKTNPVTDITPLDAIAGNDRLYGTATDSPAKVRQIYDVNVAYVAVDSDFSLVGQTYQAAAITQTSPSNPIAFTDRSYLGKSGVSDWAFGADFQSSSFALGAWLYRTYYRPYKLYLPMILANMNLSGGARNWQSAAPSLTPTGAMADDPAYLVENYRNLIEHRATAPGYTYLPTRHIEGCGESAQLGSGWRHDYLTATCSALLQWPLVEYYVPSNLSLSGQVNTYFFLNSFGALNHIVAYMYVRSTPWETAPCRTSTRRCWQSHHIPIRGYP